MAKIKWTDDEVEFLKANYVLHGAEYCANSLNRELDSILYKASALKLRRKPADWTSDEVQFLIDNYEERGLIYCMAKLNRNQSSILHKASRLKLKRKGAGRNPRFYEYDGYIVVSEYNDRYLLHRRLVEEYLGRKLNDDEDVHHIDFNKQNNDLSNLMVLPHSEHIKLHTEHRWATGELMEAIARYRLK